MRLNNRSEFKKRMPARVRKNSLNHQKAIQKASNSIEQSAENVHLACKKAIESALQHKTDLVFQPYLLAITMQSINIKISFDLVQAVDTKEFRKYLQKQISVLQAIVNDMRTYFASSIDTNFILSISAAVMDLNASINVFTNLI